MFKGCVFCITGTMTIGSRSDVEKAIKGYGGSTAKSVTGKVTHLLATPDEIAGKTKKVVAAEAKNLPIVSEAFLEDCKNIGKLLDETPYLLTGGGGGGGKKRKAAPTKAAKKPAKAAKKAPPAKAAKKVAKAGGGGGGGGGGIPVDTYCAGLLQTVGAGTGTVVGDYSYTLNQTNIGANNNKFYIGQVVQGSDGLFYSFQRWGRVGEGGQNNNKKFLGQDQAGAVKEFEAKFKAKSANKWEDRGSFVHKNGKYDLVETETNQDAAAKIEAAVEAAGKKGKAATAVPSELDQPTQSLVSWILDKDMFNSAMKEMNVDTKKCPLGAITKNQVDKGFAVLQQIDKIVSGGGNLTSGPKKKQLDDLSSRFYTIVPHSFGRNIPPAINTEEMLKASFDLVAMLGDIEIAQNLQTGGGGDDDGEPKNPLDRKYAQLKAELVTVKPSAKDFKAIKKYLDATKSTWRPVAIKHVWRVDREGEGDRFAAHAGLGNRKLLWHGTNIAAVAAILKTGLRIFPTASCGSRVGRGIYLASENGKSAGYCRTASVGGRQHGVMFLCEAPMGRIKEITRDDWTLTQAPKGYDSILAKGNTEPDPTKDTTLKIDGNDVIVPQGKPIATGAGSNFSQSEYLVYKESQCRIRYVLRCEFG